ALGTWALFGPLFSETVNGMEMGLLALTALVVVQHLYFRRGRIVLAVAIAVFVATRFEAAFYLAFMIAPLLAGRRVRAFFAWGAFGAAVFAAIAAYRWVSFGALLPNTIYAKMHEPYHLVGEAALRSSATAATELLSIFLPALV